MWNLNFLTVVDILNAIEGVSRIFTSIKLIKLSDDSVNVINFFETQEFKYAKNGRVDKKTSGIESKKKNGFSSELNIKWKKKKIKWEGTKQ